MSKSAKFKAPNYTKVPNSFVDQDLKDLGLAETKIMLVILRKTLGWSRTFVKISITTFHELTGLSRSNVCAACATLQEKGFVKIHAGEEGKSNGFEIPMEEAPPDEDETIPATGRVNDKTIPATGREGIPATGHFKEKDKEKNKQTEVVVFSCLQDLQISDYLKQKLSADHDEAKCTELVRRLKAWKTAQSTEAAIITILSRWDTWDVSLSKEEQKKAQEIEKASILESNRKWAKELYEKIKKKLHDARLFILDETRVQLNNLKGGILNLGYLDPNLKPTLTGFLKTMEIAV